MNSYGDNNDDDDDTKCCTHSTRLTLTHLRHAPATRTRKSTARSDRGERDRTILDRARVRQFPRLSAFRLFFFYHYFSFLLISHFVAKVQLSAVEKLTVKYKNNNRGNTRSCSATAAIPARGSCGFRAREYEGHEKSRMRIARRLKDYRIYLERAPHTHKRATFVAVLSHPCYIRVRTRGNEASGGRPRDFERRYRLKRAVSREPRLVPRRNV